MRKLTLIAAAAIVALPLVANAASPQKPGRWQNTVEMEMPGMPVKMPPITTNVCVTKEDVENPEKALPKAGERGCKVADYKIDGNTVTWSMTCDTPQGSISGKGKITYTADSYTGTMDMKVADTEMLAKYKGKYMGECDGSEINKKK
ncbi:MAG: hypothetical protein JWO56_2885 [Acidobacteria bacterium]|nr:hypothetical protein [Acidobacteriota bacterium]